MILLIACKIFHIMWDKILVKKNTISMKGNRKLKVLI